MTPVSTSTSDQRSPHSSPRLAAVIAARAIAAARIGCSSASAAETSWRISVGSLFGVSCWVTFGGVAFRAILEGNSPHFLAYSSAVAMTRWLCFTVCGDRPSASHSRKASSRWRAVSLLRIFEIPHCRSPKSRSWLSGIGGVLGLSLGVGQVVTSWASSSVTATASPQLGHSPPRPILRMKVEQSGHLCSPRARLPQPSHS